MSKALVGIVLGSRTDFHVMRRGLESLRTMGVPYVLEMASPQGTPDRLAQIARTAGDRGIEVIVCAASGTPQMAGAIAAHTNLPVIAVPIDTSTTGSPHLLAGLAEQPAGFPVATMGINAADNAVLFAVQILALKYSRYREFLVRGRMVAAQKIEGSFKELGNEFPDLCRSEKTSPARLLPTESEVETDPDGDKNAAAATQENRIRPGATMAQRASGIVRISQIDHLVATPVPLEPDNSTDSGEHDTEGGDTDPDDAEDPKRTPPEQLPPPPSNDEFARLFRDPAIGEATGRIAGIPLAENTSRPAATRREARIGAEIERSLDVIDTKRFAIDRDRPDQDILSHAMMVILEGGVVAFPTDTVYGLAVDATNPDAVRRLYKVKGYNASSKSLSVLIHNQDLLERLVKEVPPPIESVLETCWPGGLTVIFSKHPTVLASVSDSPSIAIRIPQDAVALTLMSMVARPLAVINAAVKDYPAAVSGDEVIKRFDMKIECLLDAGPCRSGHPSTVLSVIAEPYEILREGIIPTRDLKKMLGQRLKD
jgi:tRNA threonylcarbamoyl adenosine modification protein (Sua5/YciO/YrdC/YwlC family)